MSNHLWFGGYADIRTFVFFHFFSFTHLYTVVLPVLGEAGKKHKNRFFDVCIALVLINNIINVDRKMVEVYVCGCTMPNDWHIVYLVDKLLRWLDSTKPWNISIWCSMLCFPSVHSTFWFVLCLFSTDRLSVSVTLIAASVYLLRAVSQFVCNFQFVTVCCFILKQKQNSRYWFCLN